MLNARENIDALSVLSKEIESLKSEKAEAETKRDDAKEFKERYVKNIPFYEEKLKEAQRLKTKQLKFLRMLRQSLHNSKKG